MNVSDAGIELIRKYEAYKSAAYLCPAGVWTIGWGTTRVNGHPVKPGMTCTKDQAEAWFRADIADFERCVSSAVTVDVTQDMFDALVSFTYNVGCGALRDSTLLRKLNAGDVEGAAAEFDRWNKGGGKVLPGLVARRSEERALFEGVA